MVAQIQTSKTHICIRSVSRALQLECELLTHKLLAQFPESLSLQAITCPGSNQVGWHYSVIEQIGPVVIWQELAHSLNQQPPLTFQIRIECSIDMSRDAHLGSLDLEAAVLFPVLAVPHLTINRNYKISQ